MPIQIASYLLPKNGNGWYLVDDVYIRGGFRVVSTEVERDLILTMNLKAGCLVFVQETGIINKYESDGSWSVFQTGTVPSVTENHIVLDATSSRTATPGDVVHCDTSLPRIIALPENPQLGDKVTVLDATGTASVNAITVDPGSKLIRTWSTFGIDSDWAHAVFTYNGTIWTVVLTF